MSCDRFSGRQSLLPLSTAPTGIVVELSCRFVAYPNERGGGVTFGDDHFALIVMITRRYEVNDGVPLSSTARMMCAVPATRGVTIARGLVAS
jgi:hypothetical protein